MPRKPVLLSAILLALMGAAAAQNSIGAGPDSAANIKAHMTFLADDRLKGREAGTPEYDIAADYVAGQMKTLGLKPMGEKGSYFQTVPLVAARAKDEGKLALQDASGKATPLAFGKDYVAGGNEAFPHI